EDGPSISSPGCGVKRFDAKGPSKLPVGDLEALATAPEQIGDLVISSAYSFADGKDALQRPIGWNAYLDDCFSRGATLGAVREKGKKKFGATSLSDLMTMIIGASNDQKFERITISGHCGGENLGPGVAFQASNVENGRWKGPVG